MPIKFACVECNRLLQVKDEFAGRQVTCPKCGTVMAVPMPGTESAGEHSFGPAPPAGFEDRSAYGFARDEPAHREPPRAASQQAGGFAGIRTETGGYTPRHLPNYLVQAILCTIFCCQPFGIVAIVYAAQVNGQLATGNYRAAQASSNSARTWCWAAFLCGLALMLVWMLAFVMLPALSRM